MSRYKHVSIMYLFPTPRCFHLSPQWWYLHFLRRSHIKRTWASPVSVNHQHTSMGPVKIQLTATFLQVSTIHRVTYSFKKNVFMMNPLPAISWKTHLLFVFFGGFHSERCNTMALTPQRKVVHCCWTVEMILYTSNEGQAFCGRATFSLGS